MDEEEDGLGEDIEDTVEDHLRVGGNDISTIGETPGDGVEEPKEGEDAGGDGVCSLETTPEVGDRLPSGTEEDKPDVYFSGHSKSEEAPERVSAPPIAVKLDVPLVRGRNQGTNETSDDHDEIEEDNAKVSALSWR